MSIEVGEEDDLWPRKAPSYAVKLSDVVHRHLLVCLDLWFKSEIYEIAHGDFDATDIRESFEGIEADFRDRIRKRLDRLEADLTQR